MKRRILFLLFSVCWLPLAAQDILSPAEEAYRQGRFSQALGLYETALKNHPNDPFVYYNIGNCYFKMGSKGLAAANYYRAFRLAPRDKDIRHNLSLVLASSGDRFIPAGVPTVLHQAFYSLSYDELRGLTSIVFWCFCVLLIGWLLKRSGFRLVVLSAFVRALCAGWLYWRHTLQQTPLAVVAVPVAEIRSGPGTNFPASANLTQGHLVIIEDGKDNWQEVIVQSQGVKGWIEQSALEKI